MWGSAKLTRLLRQGDQVFGIYFETDISSARAWSIS